MKVNKMCINYGGSPRHCDHLGNRLRGARTTSPQYAIHKLIYIPQLPDFQLRGASGLTSGQQCDGDDM